MSSQNISKLQDAHKLTLTRRPVMRHLLLISGFILVGLLIFWLSGGFPATSWRLLFELFAHFNQKWQGKGSALLFPAFFLVIQSLCLVLAWCLLLWGGSREIITCYADLVRPVTRSRRSVANEPVQIADKQPLALEQAQTMIFLPEPAEKRDTSPSEEEDNKQPVHAQPEYDQPEQKVIRRLVAKPLKEEFTLGDPFKGPGELPEVFLDEERLSQTAEELNSEEEQPPFRLGNPFEGPGNLPGILREEDQLKNPFEEAEIEETVITPDGNRSVTRKPIRLEDEPAFQHLLSANQANGTTPVHSAPTTPRQSEDTMSLHNPFEDDSAEDIPTLPMSPSPTSDPSAWPAVDLDNLFEDSPFFDNTPTSKLFNETQSLQVSAITHPGLKRIDKPNEDTHLTITTTRQTAANKILPIGLFLVADGVGGHNDGKYASAFIINAISAALETELENPQISEQDLKTHLLATIQSANNRLYQHNQGIGVLSGTTLTGALVVGQRDARTKKLTFKAHIVNVGDSRTYRYGSEKGLIRITRDHSIVEELIEQKIIKPEERYTDPRRNHIFRCLGQKPEVEIDAFSLELNPQDRLLMCSDGLWEMVRDPDLQQIISTPDDEPAQITARLLQAALEQGGDDNITAIVAFVP